MGTPLTFAQAIALALALLRERPAWVVQRIQRTAYDYYTLSLACGDSYVTFAAEMYVWEALAELDAAEAPPDSERAN